MSAAPRIRGKKIKRRGVARQASIPAGRLLLLGAALLATKFYFVRELLTLLAALAVLFTVGTAICLLIVVVHEGGRWSVRKINEAKHAKVMRDLPFGWRRLEVDVHNATGKQADLAEIVAK